MNEFYEILAAQQVIQGHLHRTPLARSASLGEAVGAEVYFKLELFQKTGSFKVRGVMNKLSRLSEQERRRGVIGMSSGNHAQALAYGARQHATRATIVMPSYSLETKRAATQAYGGEIILVDDDLAGQCRRIQQQRGLTLVHPFDDPQIVAGAGTLGLEVLEDLPDADMILVSVGGGGLISGVATAVRARQPRCRVIGVEPEGAPVVRRSLDAGSPVELEKVDTVADGLCPPFTGPLVLDRVQRFVDDVVLVSDEEILTAMRLIFERVKVLAEPSAAASFSALLAGKVKPPPGARVVCVLSGGNVDCGRLKALL